VIPIAGISTARSFDDATNPAPILTARPDGHLRHVRFNEHNVVQALDPLVFRQLLESIEIACCRRQHLGDHARQDSLERVRVPFSAIDARIRPPNLPLNRLDAAIAVKRMATAARSRARSSARILITMSL
jgi:hypothetical protein